MRFSELARVGSVVAAIGLVTMPTVMAKAPANPIDGIRKELLQLPYYGVFDFLAFSYDKGSVTLQGYAYRPLLKTDAERAVKRVAGVDGVTDQVSVLPLSPNDDELRWKTYWAIYGDPFLSRYSPGGGMLWGHRHGFRSGALLPFGPARFPGTEPAGNYPIHIIVDKGRITLMGVVDSEGDKNLAGMKAKQVPLSFGVENELVVDHPAAAKKTS